MKILYRVYTESIQNLCTVNTESLYRVFTESVQSPWVQEKAEPGYGQVVESPVMFQRWWVLSTTLYCSHGSAGFKQERYDEIFLEFIEKNTPVLPNSGGREDNVLKDSENMACRKGMKVFEDAEEFPVDSLYDVLDKVCKVRLAH